MRHERGKAAALNGRYIPHSAFRIPHSAFRIRYHTAMTSIDPQNVLSLAIDTARAAGAILREGYAGARTYNVKSTETDLVTEFDHRAEQLIITRLRDAYPDHRIHAEESGKSDHDHPFTWYIDPLDGTNNFAHGLPHFCTCIALYELNQPVVGVIYDPMRDELFHTPTPGKSDGGAWLTQGNNPPQRLTVSTAPELMQSMVATGFAYDKHIAEHNNTEEFCAMVRRVRGIRRYGSAGLDLAYIAAGRFDAFWEYKLNPWDVAAAVPMITEAGGKVSNIDGSPFDITQNPVNIICTNDHLHDEVCEVIGEIRGKPRR